jgi:excinuclease ABC subunit A
MELEEGQRIQILAPVVRHRKGEYKKLFEKLIRDGFLRARINGQTQEIDPEIPLAKNKKHRIEVVVDRLIIKNSILKRLADSIEVALKLADGLVIIDVLEKEELLFSENLACVNCGISYPEISPRLFSFNSPTGACPSCSGLGQKTDIDPALLVPDPRRPLEYGAIYLEGLGGGPDTIKMQELLTVARHFGIDISTPFEDLSDEQQQILFYGSSERIRFKVETREGDTKHEWVGAFEGAIPYLEKRYRQTNSYYVRHQIQKMMRVLLCPECHGARLRKESLSIKIGDYNIAQVSSFSIRTAEEFFISLPLGEQDRQIAEQILKEINNRLGFLMDVGLDYLTLDRKAGTLSGGEAERIRLATQIGSRLVGVLYILDEPSIGLHQRDNRRLLETLKKLKELGNTVLVVEHDEETIRSADYVIDLGPGAGVHGGQVVACGAPQEIEKNNRSLTGNYLSGKKSIPLPEQRRRGSGEFLIIEGAQENNLKNIDVKIPLSTFTCVTGVSGSGKSSLIIEILYKQLSNHFYRSQKRVGTHKKIENIHHIDKVIDIDQSPIGRTPRSNPATYTGLFTPIREIFSLIPEAKARGYKPGRFSFNVKGGRCEACQGDGIIKIEMHFLADIYVKCEVCRGMRYNRETLEIRYKGKNIAEVLDMTVGEGLKFFENIPQIKRKCQTLNDVGLGYIKLGQSATTLSGGEAQRIKLSKELSRKSTGRTLYILDEPTTGLHFDDIKKLLHVLNCLTEAGNSVVIIEHNLDVIKSADYIIDLGPEGGDKGGTLVASGTPEEVAQTDRSYTGHFLKEVLNKPQLVCG